MAVQPEARSVPMDFVWGRELGRGSFGVVYAVSRKKDGRKYVIKQCQIGRMSRAEQEEAIREVHLLASLRHDYIVQYHDSFIGQGRLNIVMELCPGGDLASKLAALRQRSQRLPEASVWRYLLQVVSALRFVHSRKILHRDLKAQNVFVGTDGNVRLGDFGVSKLLESTSDLARTKVGTPYFMSPELCESRPYSSKSDIWALGCLLYEMLALRPPFESDNIASLVLKIIRGRYEPVCPTYSCDVTWLVARCLSHDPEGRPSAEQLLHIPTIRRRALLLGIAGVRAPNGAEAPGPRTPPNTPPRSEAQPQPKPSSSGDSEGKRAAAAPSRSPSPARWAERRAPSVQAEPNKRQPHRQERRAVSAPRMRERAAAGSDSGHEQRTKPESRDARAKSAAGRRPREEERAAEQKERRRAWGRRRPPPSPAERRRSGSDQPDRPRAHRRRAPRPSRRAQGRQEPSGLQQSTADAATGGGGSAPARTESTDVLVSSSMRDDNPSGRREPLSGSALGRWVDMRVWCVTLCSLLSYVAGLGDKVLLRCAVGRPCRPAALSTEPSRRKPVDRPCSSHGLTHHPPCPPTPTLSARRLRVTRRQR